MFIPMDPLSERSINLLVSSGVFTLEAFCEILAGAIAWGMFRLCSSSTVRRELKYTTICRHTRSCAFVCGFQTKVSYKTVTYHLGTG